MSDTTELNDRPRRVLPAPRGCYHWRIRQAPRLCERSPARIRRAALEILTGRRRSPVGSRARVAGKGVARPVPARGILHPDVSGGRDPGRFGPAADRGGDLVPPPTAPVGELRAAARAEPPPHRR